MFPRVGASDSWASSPSCWGEVKKVGVVSILALLLGRDAWIACISLVFSLLLGGRSACRHSYLYVVSAARFRLAGSDCITFRFAALSSVCSPLAAMPAFTDYRKCNHCKRYAYVTGDICVNYRCVGTLTCSRHAVSLSCLALITFSEQLLRKAQIPRSWITIRFESKSFALQFENSCGVSPARFVLILMLQVWRCLRCILS